MSYKVLFSLRIRRVSQEGDTPRPIQDTAIDKTLNMPVKPKNDRHNSLQIPGPLPPDKRDSIASKNTRAIEKNGSLKVSRPKRNRGISGDGICGNGPTSPTKEENNQVVLDGKTSDGDRQTVANKVHDSEKKLSFEVNATKDVELNSRNVKKLNGEKPLSRKTMAVSAEQQFGKLLCLIYVPFDAVFLKKKDLRLLFGSPSLFVCLLVSVLLCLSSLSFSFSILFYVSTATRRIII